MLSHYAYLRNVGNRVGLHYKRFCPLWENPSLGNQRLAKRKKLGRGSNPPSRVRTRVRRRPPTASTPMHTTTVASTLSTTAPFLIASIKGLATNSSTSAARNRATEN